MLASKMMGMKSAANKPVSVYLSAEDLKAIKKISEQLGVTEHAVRHFAIQRLIADWARGWRPKRGKKIIKTLEP